MKTTRFVNNQKLEYTASGGCHGGEGPFYIRDIIEGVPGDEKMGGFMKFFHDDVIPPKSTFGLHKHDGEVQEEWYYCLSGQGVMVLEDEEFPMYPGDISVCRCGGCHGIRNDGTEDLRILVICNTMPAK